MAKSHSKKGTHPSPPARPNWHSLTEGEQFSVMWDLYSHNHGATEIEKIINRDYETATPFKRGSFYSMTRKQAVAGNLTFRLNANVAMMSAMRGNYPWLNSLVTQTTRFEDIATLGAETLITTLKQAEWLSKGEVHIGFAGGHAMRLLVQTFARLLQETDHALPKKLVLHALVAGFDVTDPTTDPNTFFTLFQDETKFAPKIKPIGLQTPPRVAASEYHKLRRADWFLDSHQFAHKLDFILTSAANWSDEHSTFRKSMQRSTSSFQALDGAGCLGDMLWLPLGSRGPLNVKTDIRSMTLLELDDLADFVSQGKHVYLMLGPCAGCKHPKSEVLSAILASKSPLISHLISDTRTVSGLLDPHNRKTNPPTR